MAKTGKEIQGDIIDMLNNDYLGHCISGKVYREGYRPRDSRLEDIDVVFTGGLPEQIETGVVTVLIYCPDVDLYGDGVFVENGERTAQLERYAQEWVDSLTCEMSNYKFKLQAVITTIAIDEIHQHAVSVPLEYQYFDDGETESPNLYDEQVEDGLFITNADYASNAAIIIN